jgi:2-polyprenyl-6-methoxyphenol hydroxylase-like FAD-dependent oxidoreductase
LLRRYARARAEPVGLMHWTTDGLARLFSLDDPLVRRLRNGGMSVLNQLAPVKRALIRQALG